MTNQYEAIPRASTTPFLPVAIPLVAGTIKTVLHLFCYFKDLLAAVIALKELVAGIHFDAFWSAVKCLVKIVDWIGSLK